MKILVTGAHFTTAVAVIEELNKQKDIEIVYVGRKTTREGDSTPSIESQVLPKMSVKFLPLITGRLQQTLTIYTIPSLLKIPIGFIQSLWIILSEKPDVVLSFGGYVSVPVVISAWLLSIPIIIHEQTLISGLSNKISSIFASKIAISFKENESFDKEKTILTGNPLRKEILNPKNLSNEFSKLFEYSRKNNLPVVLVTGGNQGSHVINLAVEECLPKLLQVSCVIHQTGDSEFHDFERLTLKKNDNYIVKKWIGDEMGAVLVSVDLVISRAGINTLTELAYLGKVAIVVPIPYLYKDEQGVNAKFFESLGLVSILPQSKLSGKTLLENIKSTLRDLEFLNKQAKNTQKVVMPDAAKRLALETALLSNV